MKMNRPYNFQRPTDVTPKTWFRISNLTTDMADIAVYDEIGSWGITASAFMSELNSVTAKAITLRINSPGGDVFDGLAILNSLRNHPAQVNVIVEGLAASAASFIAMAGDKIEMSPNSMMMIHEASGLCMGNASDMRDLADLLDKTSGNIADIYASRSGRPAAEHRAAMRAETWYSDQEAVDAGLADSVMGAKATNRLPDVTKLTAPAQPTWDEIFAKVDLEAISKALEGVTTT